MPTTKEFKKLKASLKEDYLGKKVPKQYWSDYGKRYDEEDINIFAIRLANKLGIKRDKYGKS